MIKKKPLTGLFRDNPKTPEGKYLIKRRDGTIPPWPSFVLGGADPFAEVALRAYADAMEDAMKCEVESEKYGLTIEFITALRKWADEFQRYRETYGHGDPGMGPHREDDQFTIEEMRKGKSA